MRVRFLRCWRGFSPGVEWDMDGGVADALKRRGFLEYVEVESGEIVETAMIEPPAKRKRGRPRKHPLPT